MVLDDEIESAIGACFFRKTMERWVGKIPFYMLRSGMSTIQIIRNL